MGRGGDVAVLFLFLSGLVCFFIGGLWAGQKGRKEDAYITYLFTAVLDPGTE